MGKKLHFAERDTEAQMIDAIRYADYFSPRFLLAGVFT
jgi:hypothetical protein